MEKTGKKRPWKSQERFPLSRSSNNNKLSLDDRDHFLQNAKTSVASLRRLIIPSRNADHDQPGILITFTGIRNQVMSFQFLVISPKQFAQLSSVVILSSAVNECSERLCV